MSRTHEAKPKRDALEALLTRLSIATTQVREEGTGNAPAWSTSELAGKLAGMEGDRHTCNLAEAICWAFLDDRAVGRLIDYLDTWNRQRVLFRCPAVSLSGNQHRRICEVMVDSVIGGTGRRQKDRAAATNLGDRKIRALMPHIACIDRDIDEAMSLLYEHLQRQILRDRQNDDQAA